jgi:hypothetical protein
MPYVHEVQIWVVWGYTTPRHRSDAQTLIWPAEDLSSSGHNYIAVAARAYIPSGGCGDTTCIGMGAAAAALSFSPIGASAHQYDR